LYSGALTDIPTRKLLAVSPTPNPLRHHATYRQPGAQSNRIQTFVTR